MILSRNRCRVGLFFAVPWIVSRLAVGMFLSSMRVVFMRVECDSNSVWWGIQVRVGFQVSKNTSLRVSGCGCHGCCRIPFFFVVFVLETFLLCFASAKFPTRFVPRTSVTMIRVCASSSFSRSC